MVSKKKKDKQDKKSFIKKRDLKKLRELKNRNKVRKNIQASNTNSFDKDIEKKWALMKILIFLF